MAGTEGEEPLGERAGASSSNGSPAPPRSVEPSTERGRNTRARLLAAARAIFERDGFLDAKITDIAAEAGVASGSLYTYFAGKHEILAAVLEDAREEMLHPPDEQPPGAFDTPVERIEHATREYLRAYRRNAGIMRVFEQVSTLYPEFRNLRLERAVRFVERNAKGIKALQQEGHADPALDPMLASLGLSSMVGRVAYLEFVLGYPVSDVEQLTRELTRLWTNALGIDTPHGSHNRDARVTAGGEADPSTGRERAWHNDTAS